MPRQRRFYDPFVEAPPAPDLPFPVVNVAAVVVTNEDGFLSFSGPDRTGIYLDRDGVVECLQAMASNTANEAHRLAFTAAASAFESAGIPE